MSSPIQAVAFDAYGTLFDVHSVASLAEQLFPGKGDALSALWRDRQLEYSRLRTLSNRYKPFWDVTRDALRFACRRLELAADSSTEEALMNQYARLSAFPENLAALQSLRAMGMPLAILSNGNPAMIDVAVRSAGMSGLFDHVLSADAVGRFKTAPEVYALGPAAFGLDVSRILFVSSNGWDVCAATWYGFETFWINRAGAPLEVLDVEPTATGCLLTDVVSHVQARNGR